MKGRVKNSLPFILSFSMRKSGYRKYIIFLAILAISLIASLKDRPDRVRPEYGESKVYHVKRVIDGDTIVLADGSRLRYIGIDTPELGHEDIEVKLLAQQAKEFNEQLIDNKEVRLELDL